PRRSPTVVVPATGTYELTLAVNGPDAPVSGSVALAPPTRGARLDVTDGSRAVGSGRLVGRVIDARGGVVTVPPLDAQQLVSIDVSGAAVDLPAGALASPLLVTIRADQDFLPPGQAVSPAGVAIRFDADTNDFGAPATLTIPFDVGAFPAGLAGLSIYTRD